MAASQAGVTSRKYLPAVDGLRAFAVISVIINHFDASLLPGGYLGVDVFFVISGFVITLALRDMNGASLGAMLADFYARRVKRLVPALAVMVVVTMTVLRLFNPEMSRSFLTGVAALFGLSNIFLFYQASDYFSTSTQLNAFTHTWSLGVEEQFYFVFPAIFLLGRKSLGARLDLNFLVIAAASVVSLVAFADTYAEAQSAAYYLMPYRFWELGAGSLMALLAASGHLGVRDGRRGWVAVALLVLLVAVMFLPSSLAVEATVASVLLTGGLLALIWRSAVAVPVLSNGAVVRIGVISYSLYLWHWPVLCISRWTIGVSAWTAPFQVALMLMLAAASYRFVEAPLRHRKWFDRPMATVGAAVVVMGLAASLLVLSRQFNMPAFSGTRDGGRAGNATIEHGYVTAFSKRKHDDCAMSVVWSDDPVALARNVAACTASPPGARQRIVFIGDSHAANLMPMADRVFATGRVAVTNLYQTSCQLPPPNPDDPRCRLLVRYVDQLPQDDGRTLVVIRNNIAPKRALGNFGSYTAALDDLVRSLVRRGYRVVYVAPSPKYYAVGPGTLCSPQWFRPEWALSEQCRTGFPESRSEQLARRDEFMAHLERLAATEPGFYLFDPFDVLCGSRGPSCSPVRDSRLIYRDDSHLTEAGSELLAAPFMDFLGAAGLLAGQR